jgi:hypothetical protein
MSIFEIGMLVCFGAAWPASIVKSYRSRSTEGKSIVFLIILFIGYIFGILHKLIYRYDIVIFLYMLNSLMVFTDIVLFFRNKKIEHSA